MDYFGNLLALLRIEREEDRRTYQQAIERSSTSERRDAGLTWYPVAIRDTEITHGDYLTVEVERTSNPDIPHQLRFGSSAALFSNHNAREYRAEGIISHQSGNKLRLTLRTDELPDWTREGKLGIDLLFDENSYEEMQAALKLASSLNGKSELIGVLTGRLNPSFGTSPAYEHPELNNSQNAAVNKILAAGHLAIVHGPPGTGKTTTLVKAIKALLQHEGKQILVVAPSNTAVDLLCEKLTDEKINAIRIGNPVRVSEKLSSLTLDYRMSVHESNKEIKRLKKQANEYRNLAHKYKRNFGKAERDQRKALFSEAHKILKEVEQIEQYIINDTLTRAQVITATLVGANHYTIRHLKFDTVVIDEAGQAIEPACWIPILKGKKIIMAGDHFQLPPTVKSAEAARLGLAITLLEKCASQYKEAVTLLNEQYRMNEIIMQYPSQVFYENKLTAHATVAHRTFAGSAPLEFIDTSGCGFEEKQEGASLSNPEEAAFLVNRLIAFAEQVTGSIPEIAVISPYKQQVVLLKDLVEKSQQLGPYLDKISVNTVDGFQGQERDAVFISLVRSNTANNIGFLSDIRRMNVAITRAKMKLVVVGDGATLSQQSFYDGFIKYAEQSGKWHSAWEFL